MPVIHKTYEINASAEEVFEALLNPELIQTWSGDEVQMNAKVGGAFSLWGGQLFGLNLEIVKNKKLVQEWSYDQMVEASKVTFTVTTKGKRTILDLVHEDVPEKSFNSLSEGWDMYYLGAIQDMFATVKK